MSNDMVIGRYHTSELYSEAFAGIPWEQALALPMGVGRDDQLGTLRIIALLHETIHYIHDLCLGSCMNYDILMDEAAVRATELLSLLSTRGSAELPLSSVVEDSWLKMEVDTISEIVADARASLYSIGHVDTSSLSRDFPNIPERSEVSVDCLMEGIAVVKTLMALASRCETEEDLQYLHEVQHDLPLLPDELASNYHLALRIFDATVGMALVGEAGLIRDWPNDLRYGSPRKLVDVAFLMVADIALQVPPIEWMRKLVADDVHTAEHFNPIARFFTAIRIILEDGGFPAATTGRETLFHNDLFNWIAKRAGWPSYELTQGAWEERTMNLRDELRRSMSDGYRYRMIVERGKNPNAVVAGEPLTLCGRMSIPILHLTPNGLKVLRQSHSVSGSVLAWSIDYPNLDPWRLMNEPAIAWKNSLPYPTAENLRIEDDRITTFMQEVVMRKTCRSLQLATMEQNHFSCPWAGRGCAVSQPICNHVTRVEDVPKDNCALRRYMARRGIRGDRITWPKPTENTYG